MVVKVCAVRPIDGDYAFGVVLYAYLDLEACIRICSYPHRTDKVGCRLRLIIIIVRASGKVHAQDYGAVVEKWGKSLV